MISLRRACDIVVAAAALAVSSVPLALAAVAIKWDDGGPVLYRQTRVGRAGRPFQFIKLRTMRVHGGDGPQVTASGDDRITRTGRLLRRLKLDELPQFWHVLTGDMTLIGPRPEVPRFVAHYDERQSAILDVQPGLASAAQLVFAREADLLAGRADAEDVYVHHLMPAKVQIDLDYERTRTVASDLALIGEIVLLLCGKSLRTLPPLTLPSGGPR
ncbi:MAG: sugar transferase [Acidobacteria bacterium]|nr:sugar transferase [Acidobacteriota bacterium]